VTTDALSQTQLGEMLASIVYLNAARVGCINKVSYPDFSINGWHFRFPRPFPALHCEDVGIFGVCYNSY